MSNELSKPLRDLLAAAAKTLPARTGEAARAGVGGPRVSAEGEGAVVLADVSSSMAERAGARTKIDLLREALSDVAGDAPRAAIVAFGSTASIVAGPSSLPAPAGGTALHLALALARRLDPALTLVISDGRPDDPGRALGEAASVPGRIDVLYVGPDDDATAIDFMRRLASVRGGRVVVRDVVRDRTLRLGVEVRAMLALPSARTERR